VKNFDYQGVHIQVDEGVFYPTETSKIFIDHLRDKNYRTRSVLDLGCGCGVVGIILAKLGVFDTLSASDVSREATVNALRNAAAHSVSLEAKTGSLYEPWNGRQFDMIICDVSGVAEELARASSWFGDSISCNSGPDGTALLSQIILETKRYLAPGGTALFPVLTLSNHQKLVSLLRDEFNTAEEVASKQFYLPKDISNQHELIKRLNDANSIDVEDKFGFYLWKTSLYQVQTP
jgi:methylase of polypeptide subunit release factors